MEFILIITGLLAGFLFAWLFFQRSSSLKARDLEDKNNVMMQDNASLNARLSSVSEQLSMSDSKLENSRAEILKISAELSKARTENEHYESRLLEQKAEIEKIQEKFKAEFENLAAKILEEKSKKFTEQNRENLDIILNPLKEKIQLFEQKVESAYKTESAERNTLKGEIKNLIELNKQISEEANNLARALKGDTKKQGNWGEFILEKILERSGLIKDHEYKVQDSTSNDEGHRIQPDVVVYLPDEKHLIVDSKVSLTAYEALVNAETEEDRKQYLTEHLNSVKNHIRMLSEKNYQGASKYTSPDFVLMFMPIESSFSVAIQADNELFAYAWDRKIVIVSPTTLLATLRTIASLWKQEKQTRNALEIARLGGALYDKFSNFVNDLIDVGKKMDAAKSSYSDAMNKLSSGSGNIIKRVEDLKKLGAKTSKDLPAAMIERAEENSEI
ncbi:MAG: DNA recombination protein RmuC [Bacteroidetes bacterium]|nr:MAG: DNA recombination protein RmuC [Bacteroidota bacterium]REK06603.1 MAG: DNA recombination protein RmuC [Bacteroidota bacterium]REK33369.1 MAG: DNA recombination protein RmuC [Bacteroidota bacterium]REK49768.1 MAG: DNA recombination protein RmuC [Bacteroidota bacterium]